jgi:hypothetical protein
LTTFNTLLGREGDIKPLKWSMKIAWENKIVVRFGPEI